MSNCNYIYHYFIYSAILRFFSIQAGPIEICRSESIYSMPVFKVKLDENERITVYPYATFNDVCPLSCLSSCSNRDALCYHEAIKAGGAECFKEAMRK